MRLPNTLYPLGGTVAAPLPYDAEVEYIESTGTQWIDTGVAEGNPSKVAVEIDCDRNPFCGFSHQNKTVGTWVGLGYNSAWWGNFSNRFQYTDSGARQLLKWDGSKGFSQDGILKKTFTSTVGTDSISNTTWGLLCVYNFDVNARGVRAGKIYGARIWVNGAIVRDLVPVRVGTAGALYDRVSGTLFYSATSTPLVAGPDKTP